MKNYFELILISAKLHKRQYKMTILCILFSVFLVTAIFGMADMEIRSQKLQAIRDNGNWHIIVDTNEENANLISLRPAVKASGWYSYVNSSEGYTMNGENTSLSGIEEKTFRNIFDVNIVEGRFPQNAREALLTENAKSTLGLHVNDKITIKMKDGNTNSFIISGYCENSSRLMETDSYAVVLTLDSFRAIMPAELYKSQFLVQFKPYYSIQKEIDKISKAYDLSDSQIVSNTKLIGFLGQSDNRFMLQLYGVAGILFVLVLIAGVLMITSSLNSNVAQRTEFFGLMRCIGATRRQIVRFVRLEALQWCKIAIPSGIILGIVVIWGLCAVLRYLSPSYFAGMPVFGISWVSVIFGVVVGVLTVLLAAQVPAKKAAKVSPLVAISGNIFHFQRERKLIKSSRIHSQKIETVLGIGHAKSNKKNLALIVSSFAFSVILFLGFNPAVDFMHNAITPLKPYTPDVSIISKDNSCSIDKSIVENLKNTANVKRVYGRMFAYNVPIEVNGQSLLVNLISYEENQFSWAKDTLVQGSLQETIQNNSALMVYDADNPLKVGDILKFDSESGIKQIDVSGVLSTCPFSRVEGVENIICSEETFKLLTGQSNYTIVDLQLGAGITDDNINTIREIAGDNTDFSDQRLSNSEAIGAYWAFALFIYGFLVIIVLITIFNISNSIAMSVSSRLKQYAFMRAIGMTNFQLIKMVASEAIIYSILGSLIGTVIGLPINKYLFESMVTYHWGDVWRIPFLPLLIIVALVIITSILAVYGPAKRIYSMSIVSTISLM